jgi:hypothetical protein
MRKGRGTMAAALLAMVLTVRTAGADNNPNGVAFRTVGWFKGKSDVSAGTITCDIPNISNAIVDGSFVIGLWNTFGFHNFYFPDPNHPFLNPCGGWLQLQNNLSTQAIAISQIQLHYKISGAKQFRQFVPTKNGFPIACRQLQKQTLFVGAVVNPASSEVSSTSGAPNTVFIQLLPMVSPQLFTCLRSQYAALPTDLFASLPLLIRAQAVGTSDSGSTYRANPVTYALTLRHTCGNGRLDDGEECDASAPGNTCIESCNAGACATSGNPCTTDRDCLGTCLPPNDPSECSCAF